MKLYLGVELTQAEIRELLQWSAKTNTSIRMNITASIPVMVWKNASNSSHRNTASNSTTHRFGRVPCRFLFSCVLLQSNCQNTIAKTLTV